MILAALALAAAQPDAVNERVVETDRLAFSFTWPARIEGDAALAAWLVRRGMEAQADAAAVAGESRRIAAAEGFEFRPHDYQETWRIEGSSAQLLSLSSTTATYTGGAHGNMAYAALLWDRLRGAPADLPALMGPGLARMEARFCDALDRLRAEKREAPVVRDPEDPFSRCPPLAEQVLAPADSDGNGRLDTLRALIPPYVAGPYVEGDYEIEIPFETEDLARIPDGVRPAFEQPGARINPLPDE